jgi:polysaccharide biosynthesis/export protein
MTMKTPWISTSTAGVFCLLNQFMPPAQATLPPPDLSPRNPAALSPINLPIRTQTAQPSTPELSDIIPLKSGDRIRLTVVGFPDLSGEQIILSDGTIQLPMVGAISIAGLTPGSASETIITKLKDYVRRPQISIVLLALSPLRVNVIGEVLQPGPRTLEPSKNQTNSFGIPTISPITLSDAVSIAGGITPNADLRNIIIRRTTVKSVRPGVFVATRSEVKVDLWQVLQEGDLNGDPRLNYGDEIIIPTATLTTPDQQALLKSTFAPSKIRVQVAGEVQKAGQVEIAPNSSVSSAIAAAGGPTRDAKNNDILLYRNLPDGRVESQKFDFGKSSIALQDGDVIVVGEKGSSKVLDFLGRLMNPIGPLLQFLR